MGGTGGVAHVVRGTVELLRRVVRDVMCLVGARGVVVSRPAASSVLSATSDPVSFVLPSSLSRIPMASTLGGLAPKGKSRRGQLSAGGVRVSGSPSR